MKKKIISSILAVSFIIVHPIALMALTDRPQYDEQGNFVPNSFAEGDAIRYGGLFGPLTAPDPLDNWAIAMKNPKLAEEDFAGTHLNARDIGFGSGNSVYKPLTKAECRALSCPAD